MRKLSATNFESFGRGIPLDREMTVGAEKVRKRGVNKWRRRSGISITEALVGRVAVRPDHKYITKLLPEIPPSLCGCTKKSRTNTIQFHTQIQNKHNLYHKKVAGNLVELIYWYVHIWFEFALRVKTEFPGSRIKILTHSNSTYVEEKKQIVANF